MKTIDKTIPQGKAYTFKEGNISKIEGLSELLGRLSRRIEISYTGYSTVKTYRRALRDLSLFHGCLPDELEVDEILAKLPVWENTGKYVTTVALSKYITTVAATVIVRAARVPIVRDGCWNGSTTCLMYRITM